MVHELNLLDIIAYLYVPDTTMMLSIKDLYSLKNEIEDTYASIEVNIEYESIKRMQKLYGGVVICSHKIIVKLSDADFEKIYKLKCPYMEDKVQVIMDKFKNKIIYIDMENKKFEIVLGVEVLKYTDKPAFAEHSFLLHKDDRYTEGGYAIETNWKQNIDKDLKKIYLKVGDKIWLWSLWEGFQEVTIKYISKAAAFQDFLLELEKSDGDVISVGASNIEKDNAWDDGGFIFGMDKCNIIPLAQEYTKCKMKPYKDILEYLSQEQDNL